MPTVKDLRIIAKRKNILGWRTMRKAELERAIASTSPSSNAKFRRIANSALRLSKSWQPICATLEKGVNKKPLQDLAKEYGISFNKQSSKRELCALIAKKSVENSKGCLNMVDPITLEDIKNIPTVFSFIENSRSKMCSQWSIGLLEFGDSTPPPQPTFQPDTVQTGHI